MEMGEEIQIVSLTLAIIKDLCVIAACVMVIAYFCSRK